MYSRENLKRRKIKASPLSTPIPSLPDDLLLNCLGRVSRLYYPTLSLVSKTFRSLITSPELYKTRSLLGHRESCLYVCLELYPYLNSTWFTLSKKSSDCYVLAKVPIPLSPPARVSALVAVGSNIYNIGGSGSSSVSVLNCESHMWREAPSLKVELFSICASALDDKIYAAGRRKDVDEEDSVLLKDWFEVFDTKTQTWDVKPIPSYEIKYRFYSKTAFIDGKFHVVSSGQGVAYDPKQGRWDLALPKMHLYVYSGCYCVIENVLFSVYERTLRWYDTEGRIWRSLKGLVGLPNFPLSARFRLADYGGKMAFLWDEILSNSGGTYKKKIWCAVISLECRKSDEIWGTVEWFDHVLTVFEFCDFVDALAVTV